uniref:Uncharacterized protein n=1 Tax=Anopheles minimus TaxID=112268 RepID=A0A182WNP4_9DIPT
MSQGRRATALVCVTVLVRHLFFFALFLSTSSERVDGTVLFHRSCWDTNTNQTTLMYQRSQDLSNRRKESFFFLFSISAY